MAITQTAGALDSRQQIASAGVFTGAEFDISGGYAASVSIWMGPDSTTAVTAAMQAVVEVSPEASGDDTWVEYDRFTGGTTTAESEAVTGTEAAGSTTIEIASTTNLAIGQKILFKNGTAGNSEFSTIKGLVTNTSITVDPLVRAQTGATIYNQCYNWACPLPCLQYKRARVTYYGATGPTTMIQSEKLITTAL